jgi:uncharacterized metal-binding protein
MTKPRRRAAKDKPFDYRPLTDNFKANMTLMAIGFGVLLIGWAFGALYFKYISWRDLAGLTAGYFLASYWFSPDLDHLEHRPGKHSFPIKQLVKILRGLRQSGGRAGLVIWSIPLAVAEAFHGSLNILWRMLWQPLASAVTHRGVIHLPVLGTLLKWYYLGVILNAGVWVIRLLPLTGSARLAQSLTVDRLLPVSPQAFLLSHESLFGHLWTTGLSGGWMAHFASGLLLADITHILVDLWDSRGRQFLPPPHIAPRGLIYRVFRAFGVFWRF